MSSLDRWLFDRLWAARPLRRRAMLMRMGYTLDHDGTVRPTQYTEFRIVKLPPDTVIFVNGDPRWWIAPAGAALIPFYGPYVADWLDWLAGQGEIARYW